MNIRKLPALITSHPLFHEGITEPQAKDILKTSKSNYLFCASTREHQILLVYKASFRGNMECRSLPVAFNDITNEVSHSTLGKFSTLSLIANELVTFLKGFADGVFIPTPLFSHDFSITKESINNEAISSLPNDVVKANIFRLFEPETWVKSRYVSKSWCSLVDRKTLMTSIDNQKTAEVIERRNKISFIFDAIKMRLPPAREGQGNPNSKLIFANYLLSASQEYGSSILLSFSRIDLSKAYSDRLDKIGYKCDGYENGHIIIDNSNSDYGLNCLHGFVKSDLKSLDRFINLLLMICQHGGTEAEQSIRYLEESYMQSNTPAKLTF